MHLKFVMITGVSKFSKVSIFSDLNHLKDISLSEKYAKLCGITEEELVKDEQKYPLKRYGTPDDVANAAVYLLSDASKWVTGTSIKVAGGIIH